ncbi:MAG TPA: HNH endonuclease [Methanofastidiosum sp.]|nr:HNH endonuclease [Methanofastidiosum sp.]
MSFTTSFLVGTKYSNDQIVQEFGCSPQGGMRKSKDNQVLVLISGHKLNVYNDRWEGNILHYTGMGLEGDQNIEFSQNKTLDKSRNTGISVYLFESFKQKEYVFLGQVELCKGKAPYQEKQKGANGVERQVWMFPIQLKTEKLINIQKILDEYEDLSRSEVKKMSIDKLKKLASDCDGKQVSYRSVEANYYARNSVVAELAKRLAEGKCQLCDKEAPFKDELGNDYLEAHHIQWLSKGGPDVIGNTVALCPNCHRKMHIRNMDDDVRKLIEKVENR